MPARVNKFVKRFVPKKRTIPVTSSTKLKEGKYYDINSPEDAFVLFFQPSNRITVTVVEENVSLFKGAVVSINGVFSRLNEARIVRVISWNENCAIAVDGTDQIIFYHEAPPKDPNPPA
ncbi:MAG: hypothetical protein V4519_03440 [Patescibacteria group bacterium]